MEAETRNLVEVYVRHGNRKALKDLLAQRKRVIVGLNDLAFNYDTSEPIAQCEEEIALVEAALTKLKRTIEARANGITYRGHRCRGKRKTAAHRLPRESLI